METLFGLRLALVLTCLAGVVLMTVKFEAVARGLRQFFFEPQGPLNLGLLRVVIFGLLLDSARGSEASWFAGLPEHFRNFPPGWEWLADRIPLTPAWAESAHYVLYLSATLAILGVATRLSTPVAAVSAFYLFGIENCFFKISHGNHVPVLSALLLALSPCGDAVSVDAWLRQRKGSVRPTASAAYTVPVRFCWLLLGTMYLFPGLWKLWETGDLWLDGTKLRQELFDKWGQMEGFQPAFRVDRWPRLLSFMGAWTLLFEIGFFPALFGRTTRLIAGLMAVGFHVGVGLTMGIWFSPIHPLIVLLDFPYVAELSGLGRAGRWLREKVPVHFIASKSSAPAASPIVRGVDPRVGAPFVLGALLVQAMFLAGLAPIDSWPIAVYPRFAGRSREVRRTSLSLRFILRSKAGRERELNPTFRHFREDFASIFRVKRSLLSFARKADKTRFRQYTDLLLRILREECGPFEAGDTLSIYSYDFPIDPDVHRTFEPRLHLVTRLEL